MKSRIPDHKRTRRANIDYSAPGAYSVTIVVEKRDCCLGEIQDEKIVLSKLGEIVRNEWLQLAERYSYVELDEFIIMPNHFHGIIRIRGDDELRADSSESPKRLSVGKLVGAFKTLSTREINRILDRAGMVFWQKDFHDHIIRNEKDHAAVREYIVNNPKQWELDDENPRNS